MVRILGNSPERVRINDLNDVIYYRQHKDYTDQEFEQSKDLQRELRKGTIAKIDAVASPRGASDGGGNGSVTIKNTSPSVSLQDIKQAVREILPEIGGNGSSKLENAVRDIIPMLISTVRQELSSLGTIQKKEEIPRSTFLGPEYIPDISISDMTANIKADEKEVSGAGLNDALSALKNMNPNNI